MNHNISKFVFNLLSLLDFARMIHTDATSVQCQWSAAGLKDK